jgi:hypothetical protein
MHNRDVRWLKHRKLLFRDVLEKVTDISDDRQEEAICFSQLAALSDGSQTDKWSHRCLT